MYIIIRTRAITQILLPDTWQTTTTTITLLQIFCISYINQKWIMSYQMIWMIVMHSFSPSNMFLLSLLSIHICFILYTPLFFNFYYFFAFLTVLNKFYFGASVDLRRIWLTLAILSHFSLHKSYNILVNVFYFSSICRSGSYIWWTFTF